MIYKIDFPKSLLLQIICICFKRFFQIFRANKFRYVVKLLHLRTSNKVNATLAFSSGTSSITCIRKFYDNITAYRWNADWRPLIRIAVGFTSTVEAVCVARFPYSITRFNLESTLPDTFISEHSRASRTYLYIIRRSRATRSTINWSWWRTWWSFWRCGWLYAFASIR